MSLQTVLAAKNDTIRRRYPQIFPAADPSYQEILLEKEIPRMIQRAGIETPITTFHSSYAGSNATDHLNHGNEMVHDMVTSGLTTSHTSRRSSIAATGMKGRPFSHSRGDISGLLQHINHELSIHHDTDINSHNNNLIEKNPQHVAHSSSNMSIPSISINEELSTTTGSHEESINSPEKELDELPFNEIETNNSDEFIEMTSVPFNDPTTVSSPIAVNVMTPSPSPRHPILSKDLNSKQNGSIKFKKRERNIPSSFQDSNLHRHVSTSTQPSTNPPTQPSGQPSVQPSMQSSVALPSRNQTTFSRPPTGSGVTTGRTSRVSFDSMQLPPITAQSSIYNLDFDRNTTNNQRSSSQTDLRPRGNTADAALFRQALNKQQQQKDPISKGKKKKSIQEQQLNANYEMETVPIAINSLSIADLKKAFFSRR